MADGPPASAQRPQPTPQPSLASKRHLAWPEAIAHDRGMQPDPVIYREEVLTIMVVPGDQRAELERIRRLLGGEDEEEAEEEDDI